MNTTRSLPHLFAGVLMLTGVANAQQITTNWVAYNDHRAGPAVPPHVPTATSWGTALRTTRFDMGAPGNTTAVNLTNFYNGQQLPVTMTVMRTGAPDDFGTVATPFTNTPAGSLFLGVADLSNSGIVGVDAGLEAGGTVDFVTFTFGNLNPAKRYVFRGTSCRGGGYVPRWSVATITNVNGFINAHINGIGTDPMSRVLTEADFSPDLGPGQAAWNSGDNREGAVIGWDFITPMPDGTFSITVHQYTGRIPNNLMANDATYGYSFGAILLAEVEASPPVITEHPPAVTNVEQNRPFSLSVSAQGTPLLYQWYKNNAEVPGETSRTLSRSLAAVSDSGAYYVVVHNPLDRATSSVANVVVSADLTAPGVRAAYSFPTYDSGTQVATLNQLIVEFNETVVGESVDDPLQYTISGIGNPTSVTFTNGRAAILGLPTAFSAGADHTVQVTGAQDLAGNTAGTVTESFHTWITGPGNALRFEQYAAGGGVDVAILTNSPVFPDNPSFRTNMAVFDSRAVLPDDTAGNYGTRISGIFIPPFSGDWVFFLRVWDRGAVYLNPNGMDPAGRVEILHDVTGNDPRDWNKFTSSPFRLIGGQGYYIEALQKADSAAPNAIKVAARPSGTGFPTLGVPNSALDTNALAGGYIAAPLAPRDLGGALTITQGPANQTIEENHDVTFSVQVNNPSGAPLFYQWSRNGAEVPGANGPTYSYTVSASNDGDTVSVRVAKVGSVATSATATLDVVPDTTAPRFVRALSSFTNLFNVTVFFNERVFNAAEDNFSYYLEEAMTSPATATLNPDGRSVTLVFTEALTQGTTYRLTVKDVQDLAMNPMVETTLAFVAGELPRLSIALDGSDALVSWAVPPVVFNLQSSEQIASGWGAAGGTLTTANGTNTVRVQRQPTRRFFRLTNP